MHHGDRWHVNTRARVALRPFSRFAVLALPLLLLAACGGIGSSGGTSGLTSTSAAAPTNTPAPSCATALAGGTPVDLSAQGFVYPITFPTGTVATTPTQTASGVGLFTVHQFDTCSPSASVSAVQTTLQNGLTHIEHNWIGATTFPFDGGLMQPCSFCYWNPKGGPIYYLMFSAFTDHGGGVITYHGEWAVFDDAALPTCGGNFTSDAAKSGLFFLPGVTPPVPVPPFSATVPDDAAGGVRGFDLCSPGTSASITSFLSTELPRTGWTPGTSSACVFSAHCWVQGSNAISWQDPTDPTNWIMGHRVPLGA